jgi:hypothetical protein
LLEGVILNSTGKKHGEGLYTDQIWESRRSESATELFTSAKGDRVLQTGESDRKSFLIVRAALQAEAVGSTPIGRCPE